MPIFTFRKIHHNHSLIATLLMCGSHFMACGQVQPTASIAHFRYDKAGALSYTFDDGIRDQAEIAYPMFKARDLRATFFIIPSVIAETDEQVQNKKPGSAGGITWKKLKEIQDNGNEIASHSWSHPNLPKLNDEQLRNEIYKADTCIYNHLGNRPVTFAYPYNAFDERVHVAVLKDHIASRDYQQAFGNPRFTLEIANNWADKQIRSHTWGIAMIHAISNGFDAFPDPEILSRHLDYVKQHADELWIDTFANIAIYQAERDSTILDIKDKGKGKISCSLSNHLDPAIYNQPLTVIIKVPGVKSAGVAVDGKNTKTTVGTDQIMFECLPNRKQIVIKWQ